jgi:hypothetical protein
VLRIRDLADLLVERLVPRATAEACVCNDCYQSHCCGCSGCPMGTVPTYCTNCDCSRQTVVRCDPYWQCF